MNRNATIVTSVLLLHLAGLWALQSGLLRRVVEQVIPAQVLVEMAHEPEPTLPQLQPRPVVPAPQPAPVLSLIHI